MEERHGIQFIVTDKMERNEDGYRKLIVAPTNEPSTTFIAERNSGSDYAGGLPYWGRLSERYRITRYFYHYPELVEKHFGVKPQELISLYWGGEAYDMRDALRKKPSQYVPITLSNLDETIHKASNFFIDGQQHKIDELHMIFQDERLPKDEGPNSFVNQVFTLEGVKEDPYDAYGFSTNLLTEKVLKEQALKQIDNLLSYSFDNQFNKLYTYLEQKEAGIWNVYPRFDEQFTQCSIGVGIDLEQYTGQEQDLLYGLYSKVWHLIQAMKSFQVNDVIIHLPGDAGSVVYTLQEQDMAQLVDKETFDARLQPYNGND
ncbi:hypothetical protein [Paenibacillus mucilaginosus]|uniref:hypothetical protein n=1 Tax=Paenibacillus mucilaginosus TaxID=61624 RepID=UPI003D202697